MQRLAAIDIGTNSVKMTIADGEGDRPLTIIDDCVEITRLGRGVDQTKSLADESIYATLAALENFKQEADSKNARIIAGGTSAMRDAKNGEEFRKRASDLLGADVQIIDGEREAKLSFWGALSDQQDITPNAPVLAFDVGGGSTELIVGHAKEITRSTSLQIGAVRLTERALKSDPATDSEIQSAIETIDSELDKFDLSGVTAVIGIGGTATTMLSMLRQGIDPPHESSDVSKDDLAKLIGRLKPLTVVQKRDVPGLDPKRADIIFAGFLIIQRLLKRSGQAQINISSRGVRHGLLIEAVSSG